VRRSDGLLVLSAWDRGRSSLLPIASTIPVNMLKEVEERNEIGRGFDVLGKAGRPGHEPVPEWSKACTKHAKVRYVLHLYRGASRVLPHDRPQNDYRVKWCKMVRVVSLRQIFSQLALPNWLASPLFRELALVIAVAIIYSRLRNKL